MEGRGADIREAVLAAAATVLAATLAPLLPAVGLPIAAFALALIAFRYGTGWSVGAALVAALGSVLVYGEPLLAIYAVPALLAAGPLTVLLLRRTSAIRTAVVVTLIVWLALVGYEAAALAAEGSSIPRQRSIEAETMEKAAVESGTQTPGATPAQVKEIADQFKRFWPAVWPSVYFYLCGTAALIGVGVVSWVGRRRGLPLAAYPKLGAIDLSFHLVWPVIVGLAMLAWATWQGRPAGIVGAIGANLLLIVRPALFFQGFSVFAAGYERLGSSRFMRALGYVLLVLLEWMFPAISIVGVADLFINFRSLPRGLAPPTENTVDGG